MLVRLSYISTAFLVNLLTDLGSNYLDPSNHRHFSSLPPVYELVEASSRSSIAGHLESL